MWRQLRQQQQRSLVSSFVKLCHSIKLNVYLLLFNTLFDYSWGWGYTARVYALWVIEAVFGSFTVVNMLPQESMCDIDSGKYLPRERFSLLLVIVVYCGALI